MKYLFYLLSINLLFINICFSQHKHPLIEDVKIEFIEYGVNQNIFGGAKLDCSKNINDPEEERYKVYFAARFHDFSSKKTIDFNNISLVDVDNKVRYRPIGVSIYHGEWYANSIKLEDYKDEDAFLKYSQEGIENFDFFVYPTTKASFKNRKKPKFRYRMEPEHFKSKRGLKLYLSFPTFKTKKESGHFKVYWKQKLIGEFKILNGKPV